MSRAEPLSFSVLEEPHSHLVYEEAAQTIYLQVSPETPRALLRQTLSEWPG